VVAGLACVGAGTFFAQAAATGFVGRAASDDPGSASGMYLASYFSGGLVGAAVVGQLFQHVGWAAAVTAVAVALGIAAWLARALVALRDPAPPPPDRQRLHALLTTHSPF
jgi:predicted MFS family arabinose efflux permease